MDDFTQFAMDNLKTFGASQVGIVTRETLAGGPPSTDLTYFWPQAKSAIVFTVPLNQKLIPGFLKKEDQISHENNNFQTNVTAGGLSLWGANWAKQRGFEAMPYVPNDSYRTDTPGGVLDMHPDISLRYLAVRSGLGYFGFSGNLITPDHGAAVIIGCILINEELTSTDPLPAEDNYCDNCRLCMASCTSGLVDPKEMTTISLGGISFDYPKRRSYMRCNYVCGGISGLHPSGKWSTWSPGRFPLPENDQGFSDAMVKNIGAYMRRPDSGGGYAHSLMPGGKIHQTCGNCQIICHPDKEVRKERYQMLKEGGVVVQHPDGKLQAMSPEDGVRFATDMPAERKNLYCEAD